MQDYEDKCAKHGYDATDSSDEEEMLFATADEDDVAEDDVADVADVAEEVVVPKPNSYWGKNINKSSTLDHFIKRR